LRLLADCAQRRAKRFFESRHGIDHEIDHRPPSGGLENIALDLAFDLIGALVVGLFPDERAAKRCFNRSLLCKELVKYEVALLLVASIDVNLSAPIGLSGDEIEGDAATPRARANPTLRPRQRALK
jgi:hypothetical protein